MNSILLPPPASPASVETCPERRERRTEPERPRAGSGTPRGGDEALRRFSGMGSDAERRQRPDANGGGAARSGARSPRKTASEEPPRGVERTAREATAGRRSAVPGRIGAAGASRARAGNPFQRVRAFGGMGGYAPHIERNLRLVESRRDSHQCKTLERLSRLGSGKSWSNFCDLLRENR